MEEQDEQEDKDDLVIVPPASFDAKATFDIIRSTFVPSHVGQLISFSFPKETNFSKHSLHLLHLYSYRGMLFPFHLISYFFDLL